MRKFEQIDQLTEYKEKYKETINTRQYLGNKMSQIITIYTATASCTIWNILKCIKNFSEYKVLQKIIISILILVSLSFLCYELILYMNINSKFNVQRMKSIKLKEIFDKHLTDEMVEYYDDNELNENVYKKLCDVYIICNSQ